MIRREVEPSSQTWSAWKKKALAETRKLVESVQSGEKPAFRDSLYKAERVAILNNFFEKCAYCESRITVTQHIGDVEHYRPKGRVRHRDFTDVYVNRNCKHPGYYWLAYDWRNLIPACEACNRPGSSPRGLKSGKHDRFPVAGSHCSSPGRERAEEPLLLNPLIEDDPDDYLVFDPDTGIVAAKDGSKRGEVTIDVLGLNRDALIDARKGAARTARFEFAEAENRAKVGDDSGTKYLDEEYFLGRAAYSAICKIAILQEIGRVNRFLSSLSSTPLKRDLRDRQPRYGAPHRGS